jgi:cytochrome P450
LIPLPRPGGLPVVGNLLDFMKDMASFPLTLAREHGDLVQFSLGRRKVVLVSRPDWIADILVTHARKFIKSRGLQRAKLLLGNGLLTSEGSDHLRQRRLVQQAFLRSRMDHYCQQMIDSTEAFWPTAPEGEIDVTREMNRLTLEIVGKTLFDADVASQAQEVRAALSSVLSVFPWVMMPFGELLDRLPVGPAREFREARRVLDAILFKLIDDRRQHPSDRGDLLSMLLMATDEADGGGMSNQQLRDELMTIFLAGHETTANAMSWTWWLLARHPEVEARLHRELDDVLGQRALTPADVDRLPYTRRVLSESMRLQPPAFLLGRQCTEPYRIGEYGFPAKSGFFMSPYVSHRDPRYFPDPERFDPDRFLPEVAELRPKFSYYPFGGGNRVCVGERFAWSEGILLLASLARRWRFELRPGFKMQHRASMVLRPLQLPMRILPRQGSGVGRSE